MKPWEAAAQKSKGKPWEHYANEVFSQKSDPTEGTYKMVGSSGEAIPVPFSRVLDAGKAGFQIHPEDFKRFTKDYNATLGPIDRMDVALAPEDESTWAGKGLNVLKGTAAGLAAPFAHPIQTGQSGGEPFVASGFAPGGMYPTTAPLGSGATGRESEKLNQQTQKSAQEDMASQAAEMKEHPVYSASTIVGPAVVTAGLEKYGGAIPGVKAVRALRDQAAERMRSGLRNKFGGGTEFTQKKATEFKADTDVARAKGQAADEATEAKRGAADDTNKARQESYQDRVEAHKDKVQTKQERHQETVADWNKKRAEKLKAHQDAIKQTQQENAQALQEHLQKREEASKHNQGLRESFAQRQRVEQEVQAHSADLEKKINDAEVQSKGQDDTNWEDIRKKNQGVTTPIEPLQDVVEREAAKADPATSALFKSILKGEQGTLPDITITTSAVRYVDSAGSLVDPQGMSPAKFDQMVEKGEITKQPVTETVTPNDPQYSQYYQNQYGQPPPLSGPATFERLQRWYSYVTNKMYGGGHLEGGIFNALKNVRKALNDAMENITNQTGTTADLGKARDYHQERMEAFSDSPREDQTVATDYKKQVSPEYEKEQALERKAKKLAKFDKEIPVVGQKLRDAHAMLKKLPDEEAARTGQMAIPEPPVPKPLPQAPEIPPEPKPPELPKPPKPPSKKPYPEPKGRESLPAVEDWTPERIEKMRENIKKYGATGQWVTRLILGAVGEQMFSLMSSHPSAAHVGVFSSGLLVGQGMMRLFANIMSHDNIVEWLATPTAEDLKVIEQLPPDQAARLRTGIQALRDEAAKRTPEPKGFKINPVVAAFLGGQAKPVEQPKTLDELRKEADQRKPQAASPPGPQSSAKPAHTHVYDEEKGMIVPV